MIFTSSTVEGTGQAYKFITTSCLHQTSIYTAQNGFDAAIRLGLLFTVSCSFSSASSSSSSPYSISFTRVSGTVLAFDFFEILSLSHFLLRETDEVNLGGGGGGGMLLEAGRGIEEVFLGGGGGSRIFRKGGAVPFDGGLSNFFEGGRAVLSSSSLLKEHM